jgi:hypothetical protein
VKNMPLSDAAWALIVHAAGEVRGKGFWMSRRTWVALLAERPRGPRVAGKLYSVPVLFDDSMSFGMIKLLKRGSE